MIVARTSSLLASLAAAALLATLAACGGSSASNESTAPPQPTAAPTAAPTAEAASKTEDDKVPTACSSEGGDMCLPPVSIARRVCAAGSPELSLSLFAKGTPWVRGYLTRTTDAWDASGGPSSNDKLQMGEEVLILVRRVPNTGGMVVSGASGSYDVLRWDGNCASLMAEEVSQTPRGAPGYADIPWKKLDDNFQEALRADEKIANLVAEQKKECKGVSRGEVSAKCERAHKALSKAIVEYVRRGGTLPAPPKLPPAQ